MTVQGSAFLEAEGFLPWELLFVLIISFTSRPSN